jgi:hypothetical protein
MAVVELNQVRAMPVTRHAKKEWHGVGANQLFHWGSTAALSAAGDRRRCCNGLNNKG